MLSNKEMDAALFLEKLAGQQAGAEVVLDVSVVVPVYNEVESLPHLIEAIASSIQPSGLSYQIICVDDGSKDGSAELLQQLASSRDDLCAVILRPQLRANCCHVGRFRSRSRSCYCYPRRRFAK
jgi:glycosyltransferase involved in cell wall biosynthesis